MTHTPRKNVIMGSFHNNISLAKWKLINERDKLFDSYCDTLEKKLAWDANGYEMAMGMSHNSKLDGLKKMKAILTDTLNKLSVRMIELDNEITQLGRNEPPDALTSHDDHTS